MTSCSCRTARRPPEGGRKRPFTCEQASVNTALEKQHRPPTVHQLQEQIITDHTSASSYSNIKHVTLLNFTSTPASSCTGFRLRGTASQKHLQINRSWQVLDSFTKHNKVLVLILPSYSIFLNLSEEPYSAWCWKVFDPRPHALLPLLWAVEETLRRCGGSELGSVLDGIWYVSLIAWTGMMWCLWSGGGDVAKPEQKEGSLNHSLLFTSVLDFYSYYFFLLYGTTYYFW